MMASKNTNIAIIEPSEIIVEGLKNILGKTPHQFKIIRFENISDIIQNEKSDSLDILIINPILVIEHKSEFHKFKNTTSQIYCLAVIYQYFDKKTLSIFDDIIEINEQQESILMKIQKILNFKIIGIETHRQEQLSDREKDVLIHLVSGLSNKEIAKKLHISIHTVISHRKKISEKTGIKSQSGLTIYAISNKIISLESSLL